MVFVSIREFAGGVVPEPMKPQATIFSQSHTVFMNPKSGKQGKPSKPLTTKAKGVILHHPLSFFSGFRYFSVDQYQKLIDISPVPKTGASSKAITDINLIMMFNDGPEVSFMGSPTASPVTPAL